MSELSEQIALFEWASTRLTVMPELAYMFAVPNGGKRAKKTAADLQRSGLKSGVPDLCLPVARQGRHGLWVELKISTGRVTENQSRWLAWLEGQGYRADVCRSWQKAAAIIEVYMGVPLNQRTVFYG